MGNGVFSGQEEAESDTGQTAEGHRLAPPVVSHDQTRHHQVFEQVNRVT